MKLSWLIKVLSLHEVKRAHKSYALHVMFT